LAGVVDELTHCGLLTLTLPIQCQTCGLQTNLPLPASLPPLSCPGCGAAARFIHHESSPPLTYTASSVLTRAQVNGTLIPVAATVLLHQQNALVIPGVDVDLALMEGRGTVPSRPSQWAGTRDLDLLGWHGSAVFTGEAFGCWAPGSLRPDLRQRRAACDHRATHGAAVTLRRRCCREAGHVARGPG
jgi:hypothetical protein